MRLVVSLGLGLGLGLGLWGIAHKALRQHC